MNNKYVKFEFTVTGYTKILTFYIHILNKRISKQNLIQENNN